MKVKIGDTFTNSVGKTVIICNIIDKNNFRVMSHQWPKGEEYDLRRSSLEAGIDKGTYTQYKSHPYRVY